jgi:mono/diheme cytochrome c family protein
MRLIQPRQVTCALALACALFGLVVAIQITAHADGPDVSKGRAIFRFDTFGDEQLWTTQLRMHEVIQKAVDPLTALGVGLKVDVDALPAEVIAALRANAVPLDDPAVTLQLLQLDAVVGVKGHVEDAQLTSVGITCALCHSTVDDSFMPGIGRRLDGWANRDLNVGAILALSPFEGFTPELKSEFMQWGPGKYDPRHHAFDGVNLLTLHESTLPVVLPSIYGLRGVGFETYTADGPISYWNSYVGVGQMGGHGTFIDQRIGLVIQQSPDVVTPKLQDLLAYQLSLKTPEPPRNSFDRQAANRGRRLFRNEANCASCHQGPTFTDVLKGPNRDTPLVHDRDEIGTEADYALRSATGGYRTTPLRGLWQHPPYFHDGSAPDLPAVVEHYDQRFGLNLSPEQKRDLVEYLKTL